MTSRPAFEPDRGLLRLPAAELTRLAEAACGPEPDPATPGVLEELGAIRDGRLHEALEPIAAVMAAPVARIGVRVGRPAPELAVTVWLGTAVAVASLPAGTVREVVVVHTSAVADLLGGMLSLGPRPVPLCAPVVLPAAALRALLRGVGAPDVRGVLEAAGIAGPARGALARLGACARASWVAASRWPVDDGLAERGLQVLDGGRAGWWQHEPLEGLEAARLSPVSGRWVYRQLTALVPVPEELCPTRLR